MAAGEYVQVSDSRGGQVAEQRNDKISGRSTFFVSEQGSPDARFAAIDEISALEKKEES
jgi:hypothetical protein